MKIYNERAISDYAHSTGPSGMAMEARRVEGYGREMNQDAATYEKQAKDIYSSAVKFQWQNSVNELMNNPEIGNNPKKMESEINKLNNKMSSEIIDNDVKVDFIANSILNSRAYVNHARNNFIRIQNEREKSNAFNSIYAGMDLAGISALNILSGGGNEGDIDAYMNSRENVISQINSKYPDGTYIFTDEQRLRMANDFDKNVIKSFKAAYDNARDDQKEAFYHQIMNDNSFVVQSEKGPININAKDVITPTMMKDVKNYVRDAHYKTLAEKEKEYKYNKIAAIAEFGKNPTKAGLEQLKEEFPDIKKKKLDELEDTYKESPNYMAETQPEALSMAIDKINEIATKETTLEDGSPDFDKQLDLFIKANEFINKQSTGKDAQLGYDDVQMLREKASRTMIDQDEKAISMALSKEKSSLSSLISSFNYNSGGDDMAFGEYGNKANIDVPYAKMIAKNTIYLAERALSDKSIPQEERVKKAKDIYKDGKERLIRIKNPEIGDKGVGDKFTKNGITYEIVSFDDNDVQVRVSK